MAIDPDRDTALRNIALAIAALGNGLLGFQTYSSFAWTPALQFGGSAAGMTITTAVGQGTQIGRMFYLNFTLILSSKGTSTGAATISGYSLSAAANGANNGSGGIVDSYGSMSSLTSFPVINVGSASSMASLLQFAAASVASITDANFTNNSRIAGQFSFFV